MESLLLLLTLLVLSFVFSGYETAFFSIPAGQRERLSLRYPYLNIQRLQADSTTLLNVLLLMNLLANTLNSFVFASIMENLVFLKGLSHNGILVVQIIGFFLILLFTGEITPKVIAIRRPEFFLKNFSVFIFMTYRLTGWIVKPVSSYFNYIFSKRGNVSLEIEEIIAELKGLFPDVSGIFTGISIVRGNIRRVMRNKRYVVSVEKNMDMDELDKVILKHPHSIYPVKKQGEITEVLNLRKSNTNSLYFEDVRVVPETLTVLDYLRDVDDEIHGFRVVVSEHGEYIGISTLDDLLKVLSPDVNIKELGHGLYIIDGRASIEDIERRIGISLDTETDTLMGYIMEKTGKVPEEGERFTIEGVEFEVLSRKSGEIKLVKVKVR